MYITTPSPGAIYNVFASAAYLTATLVELDAGSKHGISKLCTKRTYEWISSAQYFAILQHYSRNRISSSSLFPDLVSLVPQVGGDVGAATIMLEKENNVKGESYRES